MVILSLGDHSQTMAEGYKAVLVPEQIDTRLDAFLSTLAESCGVTLLKYIGTSPIVIEELGREYGNLDLAARALNRLGLFQILGLIQTGENGASSRVERIDVIPSQDDTAVSTFLKEYKHRHLQVVQSYRREKRR